MHATRIVMFLLGGWIFCTLGVDAAAFFNLRLPAGVIANPPPEAEKIIKDYGPEQAGLLLRHFAAEANRYFFSRWERMEILLGLVLIPFVFAATDRKPVPPIVAALMLVLALFQYYAVTPELAYRGRQADFPPGRANVDARASERALAEVYFGTELALVLIGGALACYVASYKSRRRVRNGADPARSESIASRI
jgi:hypothetical protein